MVTDRGCVARNLTFLFAVVQLTRLFRAESTIKRPKMSTKFDSNYIFTKMIVHWL